MKIKIKLIGALILLLATIVAPAYSQKPEPKVPKFDVIEFDKKFATVRWLIEYDEVAWKTSDVVLTEDKAELAKLGGEWFCLQDSKLQWHAFYGKLADGKFDAVSHYTFGPKFKGRSVNREV